MATLKIEKFQEGGKVRIKLLVEGKLNKELTEICDGLGIKPETDLANARAIFCDTPEELNRVRNPFKARAVGTPDKNGRIEIR